jgi:hypothetical protein
VNGAVVFQRSDSGRDEIYAKTHGLTQSERLVLTIIDGVTPYDGLRQKLKGLSRDRFDRALSALLKKHLVFEVLFPVEDQKPETLDAKVTDRFLQQDPLDPVTIIVFDTDDEFGGDDATDEVDEHEITIQLPNIKKTASEMVSEQVVMTMGNNQEEINLRTKGFAKVDFYLPLEPQNAKPFAVDEVSVSAERALPPSSVMTAEFNSPAINKLWQRGNNKNSQWSYWIILGGLVFILGAIILFGAR